MVGTVERWTSVGQTEKNEDQTENCVTLFTKNTLTPLEKNFAGRSSYI